MIANPLSYVNSKHSYSFDVVNALFRNKIMATHYDAIMTLLCSSILLYYTKCGVLVFPSLNDIHVSLFYYVSILFYQQYTL